MEFSHGRGIRGQESTPFASSSVAVIPCGSEDHMLNESPFLPFGDKTNRSYVASTFRFLEE